MMKSENSKEDVSNIHAVQFMLSMLKEHVKMLSMLRGSR